MIRRLVGSDVSVAPMDFMASMPTKDMAKAMSLGYTISSTKGQTQNYRASALKK